MECTERAESITALVDGELSAAESAALQAHLATCSFCARALEDERAVAGRLRALPLPGAPANLRAEVMARVAEVAGPVSPGDEHAAPPRGRILHLWPWLAGGAGLAAGILLLLKGGALQSETEVAAMAPQSRGAAAPARLMKGEEGSLAASGPAEGARAQQDESGFIARDPEEPPRLEDGKPGKARPARPHGEVPENSRTRDAAGPAPAPTPSAPKDRPRTEEKKTGDATPSGGIPAAGEVAPDPVKEIDDKSGRSGRDAGDRGADSEAGDDLQWQAAATTTGPAIVAVFLQVENLDAAVRSLDAALSSQREVVRERAWMRNPVPAGPGASAGVGASGAKAPSAPPPPSVSAPEPTTTETPEEERERLFEQANPGVTTFAKRNAPPGQRVAVVRVRASDLGRLRQALGALPGFRETHAVVLRDPDAERRRMNEEARARSKDLGARREGEAPDSDESAEEAAARASREHLERSGDRRTGATAGEPVPPPRPDAAALRDLAEAAPDAAFTGVALGSTLEGDRNRDVFVQIHLLAPGADPLVESPADSSPEKPPSGGK